MNFYFKEVFDAKVWKDARAAFFDRLQNSDADSSQIELFLLEAIEAADFLLKAIQRARLRENQAILCERTDFPHSEGVYEMRCKMTEIARRHNVGGYTMLFRSFLDGEIISNIKGEWFDPTDAWDFYGNIEELNPSVWVLKHQETYADHIQTMSLKEGGEPRLMFGIPLMILYFIKTSDDFLSFFIVQTKQGGNRNIVDDWAKTTFGVGKPIVGQA